MGAIEIACIVLAILVVLVQVVNIIVWLLRLRRSHGGTIIKRRLVGISFDTEAVKSVYKIGDEFTCEGLIVYAQYNTAPYREIITDLNVEMADDYAMREDTNDDVCHIIMPVAMDHVGMQIVRGAYNGKWSSYNITIEEDVARVVNIYNYGTSESVTEVASAEAEDEPMDTTQMITILENSVVEESESGAVVHNEDGTAIFFRYNKSFTAKLIQAKDEVREYYNSIKNYVLSYKKVKAKISWSHENVHIGKEKICWFVFKGKSLYLYLPLNAQDYADSKYKVEHINSKRYEEVPCEYKIKNARRAKYATELIAKVMERFEVPFIEREVEDYISAYPYEETLSLLKKGLIKVTKSKHTFSADELRSEAVEQAQPIAATAVRIGHRTEITVSEAKRLMLDKEAEAMVVSSIRRSDPTRKGKVTVDVLSEHFENGETVTIEEMKTRIPGFDKKATYIKVLAGGTLNKQLTVEADEYTPDAIKMIVLMDGQVLRTKSK